MEETRTLKNKAISGMLWKILENGGTQGIQFVTTIVLARLLDPSEYAVLTITTIFISIATILVQRGFGLALIQREDVTESDYSSAFFLGLAVAAVLAVVFWFGAPLVSDYYREPAATPVLRAMSVMLFIAAGESVQNAIITRKMEFRKIFIASLASVLASGTVGIAMAYLGFGVWALVAQQITSVLVMCGVMWLETRWTPKLIVSLTRTRALLSYGWKLLVSALIDTLYLDVSGLVIGRIDSTEMLAHYSKGKQFPQVIGSNLNTGIQAAMFPAYARTQNDRGRTLSMLRRTMSSSAFVIAPLLFGMAAVAEPMVSIVLTDKWLPCVPFLRIACITYAMYPLESTGLHAINALGRSDVYLKLEILKKSVGALLLCVSVFVFRSTLLIVLSLAATGAFAVAADMVPLKRLLGYRYRDQLRDVLPSLSLSLLMFGAVYAVELLGLGRWATLLSQIALGVLLYVFLAWALRLAPFTFLLRSAKEFLAGRRLKKSAPGKETEQ